MASVRPGALHPWSFDLRKENGVDNVRMGNKRELEKEEGVAGVDKGLGIRERERVTQVYMYISLGTRRRLSSAMLKEDVTAKVRDIF